MHMRKNELNFCQVQTKKNLQTTHKNVNMSQQEQQQQKKKKKWAPLESNPELMNKYLEKSGLANAADYQFCEVFGFDDDLLAMVPQPCVALMFLFPITKEVCADKKLRKNN